MASWGPDRPRRRGRRSAHAQRRDRACWHAAAPSGQNAGEVVASAASSVALRLTEGSLAAEPTLLVGETEVTFGSVRYALASELPSGSHPLVVRADKKGRLVSKDGEAVKDLALRQAVIYVQKILR